MGTQNAQQTPTGLLKTIGKTQAKPFPVSVVLLSCSSSMDYIKIAISIILVVVFYILFGQESIAKLKKGGISISRNEEEPQRIKEPGYMSNP